MWALGDYAVLADRVISDLGQVLTQACGVRPGDRVLDIAAGSGNAAIPAALAGASVVACDLTPELLAAGQQRAERQGAELEWRQADAEALPFADGEFDVVMSCLGIMFAPHHQAAVGELLRVCRPGATIGLLSWTPEGFIGQMFAAMKPYAAPPPPGAQPPPLWGREDHVCSLLGARVTDIAAHRRTVRVEQFTSTEISATASRPVTGRPSPPTAASPTTRSGPPHSTMTSPTWPAATTTAPRQRSWTGNTCCSQPARNPDHTQATPGQTQPARLSRHPTQARKLPGAAAARSTGAEDDGHSAYPTGAAKNL
jgi:SAM-dependent methyltransferase